MNDHPPSTMTRVAIVEATTPAHEQGAMSLVQHLLCKLAEEASEVSQMAMKAQQFGMHEAMTGKANNRDRLRGELNDLLAIVEMLNDLGMDLHHDRDAIEAKKERVHHYLKYSVELGEVHQDALLEYEND